MDRRSFWLVAALTAVVSLAVLLLALSQPVAANPGDVVVNRVTGSDLVPCGTSPPCYSIYHAVENVAAPGDRVLVHPGTYTETFTMTSGIAIESVSGPLVTIIDGEGVRGPMVTANSASVTATASLEGFTIRGGSYRGITIDSASPVISDCIVTDNRGESGGGIGIEPGTANVQISHSSIISNSAAGDGGGIWVGPNASLTLLHSHVLSNTGLLAGGGIAAQGAASLVVSDTLFVSNTAASAAGLLADNTDLILADSKFYSNTTPGPAGGARVRQASTFLIYNCTFEHNSAAGAGGIGIEDGPEGSIVSNTVRYNQSSSWGGGIGAKSATALISDNLVISNTAGNLQGGGLYLSEYSGTVAHNTVSHNETNVWGGGIHVLGDSHYLIWDNDVEHNKAGRGTDGGGMGGIGIDSPAQGSIVSNTIRYNKTYMHWGGGIGISGATVLISGNHIISNTVPTHGGGGIQAFSDGYVEIRNNLIEHNSSGQGGGIGLSDGRGFVISNTLRHNSSPGLGGGGISVGGGTAYTVSHNLIAYNTGGGIRAQGCPITIENNFLIRNNRDTPSAYGQLIMYGGIPITISNNTIIGNGTNDGITIGSGGAPIIANNVVALNGRGIRGSGTITPSLDHNDLWQNVTSDYDGVTPGATDLACDPDFVDAAQDDFHLGICSCAVDAGTDTGAPPDDYDRDARPVDGDADGTPTVDIGADERLTVTAPLPKAGFTHTVTGRLVQFTNTSSDSVSYEWDYGDGSAGSTEVNPSHTYMTPGGKTVVLTSTTAFGCSDTAQDTVLPVWVPLPTWQKEIYVNDVLTGVSPIPIAAGDLVTVVDQISVSASENVTFTLVETATESLELLASDQDMGAVISATNTLTWTVEDVAPDTWYTITKTFRVLTGTWDTDIITESLVVEDAIPQQLARTVQFKHLHPEIGIEPLVLSASLEPGGKSTRTLTISNLGGLDLNWDIAENPQVAWLTEVPTAGTVIPDRSVEVGVTMDAGILSDGVYSTTLEVRSNDLDQPQVDVGVVLTVTTTCTAIVGADLSYTPTSPHGGETVQFTASVSQGMPPISWTWSFGDGGSGGGQVVTHTYPLSPAVLAYTVVMTASNGCPSQDVVSHEVLVWPHSVYLPFVVRDW